MTQPDSEAFYDKHWETADTSADVHVLAKAARVVRMIPGDVRTIVDVGCGDGTLTHRLAERFDVTAVDRSPVALARIRCRSVQASADALPFEDGSADLVFSSEMLEHLPGPVLAGAAREFERVARRYLLVAVPHAETLRRRFARCPRCGLEFHIDGHLHAFDAAALDRLFSSFRRVATELEGAAEPPTFAPIEEVRQRLARAWWVWDGARIVCPSCGEDRFRKLPRGAVHRAIDRQLDRATRLAARITGRAPVPYWILSLYERR